ncbi:hypothetical protein C7974DRAFT_376621 [Boeremia exigua]|uniref:uncharacterized protein n=1 Tax=Boeremia exigua TaxID=749465 RepID=UPI001E8CF914|nr:uncharacterized protein C7974DRAFT_376621 [Boeremia exigua]KAH6629836.1 hypothetical protein C7974DRAFT_376621 [Boeremia exigua]
MSLQKRVRVDVPRAEDILALTTDTPGFFSLPQELRDMVYVELWQDHGIVAVTQRSSEPRTDADLDDAAKGVETMRGMSVHAGKSTPGPLPKWLLLSKTFLHESMAAFNTKSHWVLDCKHLHASRSADTLPMLLSEAKSISLTKMTFSPLPRPSMQHWHKPMPVTIQLHKAEAEGLERLADCLHQQNQIKRLVIPLEVPHADVLPVRSAEPRIDLSHLEGLLRVLVELECLELELLDSKLIRNSVRYGKLFEQELFDEIMEMVKSVWGDYSIEKVAGGVEERRTLTATRYKPCKLIFTRNVR